MFARILQSDKDSSTIPDGYQLFINFFFGVQEFCAWGDMLVWSVIVPQFY